MLLLLCALLSILVGFLSGGSLKHLGQLRFRLSPLVLIALAIQFVIFGSWGDQTLSPGLVGVLYVLSLTLLMVVVWVNRRIPGIPLLGLGLAMNSAAILANGGRMPARLEALITAGITTSRAAFESGRTANSAIIDSATRLWFLCDIIGIPAHLPFANVFSIGDLAIALGAGWLIIVGMRPPSDKASITE